MRGVKHKCKDCVHCDVINLVCRPESKDCREEYKLEKEDLEHLEQCDFFCKKMNDAVEPYISKEKEL